MFVLQLPYQSEFSGETDSVGYIETYIKKKSIMGLGSYSYGDQEVPQSAVYKLQMQEGWSWNPSPNSEGLRTRGVSGISPSSSLKAQEPKGRRR